MAKKICVFVFLFIAVNSLKAQSGERKFLFETNLFRYSPTVGSFQSKKMRLTILNTVKLGYLFNNENAIKIGLGRINEGYIYRHGFGQLSYYGSGFELTSGYEKCIKLNKRFNYFIEASAFYERLKETGDKWSDNDSLTFEINHVRNYFGGYIDMKIACNITENISVYYAIRDRFGAYKANGVLTKDSRFYTIQPSFKGYENIFEVLNFGVKVKI